MILKDSVKTQLLMKNQELSFNKFHRSNEMHGVTAVTSHIEGNTTLHIMSIILYYPNVQKDDLLYSFTDNVLDIFRRHEKIEPVFFVAFNERDNLGNSNYSIYIKLSGRYCKKHKVEDFDLHGIHPYFLKAPVPKCAVKFVTRNLSTKEILENTKAIYCSNRQQLLTEYLGIYPPLHLS